MKTYVFAIASVTTLAGVVAAATIAGCSSSDSPSPAAPVDSGTVDSGKTTTKTDAGGGDDDDDTTTKTCLSPTAIDATKVPYKSPLIQAGACPSSVLTQIDTFINANPNAEYADLKGELAKTSAGCASCVFGTDGDKWPPIIEDGTGKVTNIDVGGCIEIASGKADCGKAYQQWDSCLDEACTSCSDSDYGQCTQDAQADGAACGTASAALQTACGANVNDYIDACYKAGELIIKGPIQAQCIGTGIGDAGTD